MCPSSPDWLKRLKELSKKKLTREEIKAALDAIMDDPNDRAAILMGAALIENVLRTVIQNRMIELSETEQENLFGRDAPLSSFSGLIRIGYAFGYFDDVVKRDLDRLREIRNIFAHSQRAIGFQTPAVKNAISGFSPKAVRPYLDLPIEKDDPRTQFVTMLGRLSGVFKAAPALKPPLPTPMSYPEDAPDPSPAK
jgi:hypothetical protein